MRAAKTGGAPGASATTVPAFLLDTARKGFPERAAAPPWPPVNLAWTPDTYELIVSIIMTKPTAPATVVKELNRQFNQELAAAHAYLALSVWCDFRNLKGFGKCFGKQAGEERAHADRIIKHLTDRGLPALVAAVPAPRQELRTLLEVAEQVQRMENANTQGVNAVYEAAVTAKDYPAQVLMHWFIKEQVEEEDWSREMVERVEAATCAGSLSDLDRHIERYLEQEVREVPAKE